MDCAICRQPVLDTEQAYRCDGSITVGTVNDAVEQPRHSEPWAQHVACMNKPGQRIHITADGPDFSCVSAKIVQPDGSEINISSIVKAVTIKVTDQDLNTALIEFEGVEFDIIGDTPASATPIG